MIGNGKTNQDIENVVVCLLEVGMVGQKVGNMVDVGKVSCKVHRVVDIGLGKRVVIHIHSKYFHANFGDMSQNMALVLGKNVGHNRLSNVAQMSKVPPFDNSSLHSLETQVSQLAKHLATRSPNTFPSDTEVNPKGECKAITLRSGKVLEDNSEPKSDKDAEDKIVEDSPVKSTTKESTQAQAKSPSPSSLVKGKEKQIPFPTEIPKRG
ncbi:hypothetical protein PIB30_073742 [Stylosanthes scabra]|uniref:Uncharacterized protein n=1 Tax=Stylosanthes scabra TaxID=79078 RepID=A0ABU6VQK7_9FABA|nr:hypothetical protein [Stylosanthes scabra]